MTDVSNSPAARHEADTCIGSGDAAAPGLASWLSLAAAPTFAAMALWSGLSAGQPDVLCMAVQGGSPLGGMMLMYALMSAFHVAPWLRLLSRPLPGQVGR